MKTVSFSRGDAVLCLGNFDGVHLGHQALLSRAVTLAKASGAVPAVFCFERDPEAFFHPGERVVLSDFEEKKALLFRYGIGRIYASDFDVMRDLTPDGFIAWLVKEIGPTAVVCGRDFRFGRGGEGTVDFLRANAPFPVHVVDDVLADGEKIASTRIRRAMADGDFDGAVRLLGHPYVFCGEVVPGQKLGRALGFPTANINVGAEKVLPTLGVYASTVTVDGKTYPSVSNLGVRPTVSDEKTVNLESYLIDGDLDLYGKPIEVAFLSFIRPEKTFADACALKDRLNRDLYEAKKYHTKNQTANNL